MVSSRGGLEEVVLLRHGQTDYNIQKRFCGSSDVPLNSTGIREAELLAGRLKGLHAAALFSSPLSRARQTAEAVAASLNLHCRIEPRLKELDHGTLEGRTRDEVMSSDPDALKDLLYGPCTRPLPGGESMLQVQERAWSLLSDLLESPPGERVVLVTHQMVVLTLVCKVLEAPLSSWRKLRTDRASITILRHQKGNWVLYRLNDSAHLEK